MNLKLFHETITENNYTDLIRQLVDVFRISNSNQYIFLSLKIEEGGCTIQMSILNKDGNNQTYEALKMDTNNPYFYPFLNDLVLSLRNQCKISKEDIVNLDQDSFVAFRMITDFNDLITIDGLTEREAKELLSVNL
ncbi:MAG: hypothetical protein J6X28_02440 [Bacilli bacterium]|nr:hypothetical protein [Bacilli bacterium]